MKSPVVEIHDTYIMWSDIHNEMFHRFPIRQYGASNGARRRYAEVQIRTLLKNRNPNHIHGRLPNDVGSRGYIREGFEKKIKSFVVDRSPYVIVLGSVLFSSIPDVDEDAI